MEQILQLRRMREYNFRADGKSYSRAERRDDMNSGDQQVFVVVWRTGWFGSTIPSPYPTPAPLL